MNKTLRVVIIALVALYAFSGTSICASEHQYIYPPVTGISSDDTLGSKYAPITKELISMLNHNPVLKAMLEKSIAKAKANNPDIHSNPAQTLEQYYSYIDWASKALPWNSLPDTQPNTTLYERISNSVGYFYFLIDQPLKELADKGYYHNSIQYIEPFRTWIIQFIAQWGSFLNTTASWNNDYYKLALADKRFNLDGSLYEDPKNWKTFNQFFARYLSSPDKRPIASAQDDSVVTAPADATPLGAWRIDSKSNIVHEGGVNIKSGVFTSVEVLLGNSAYKTAFVGGFLTHLFLDISDYHRYHFPVSGIIKEVLMIPHDDAVGGVTIWDTDLKKYRLTANATPGWQNIETRGCVIVETENHGLVAILPVGMAQISSVNFEKTVQVGAAVKKGDMLGCFLFGGSNIVMLFQKDAGFELSAAKASSGAYAHINMGVEYGKIKARIAPK